MASAQQLAWLKTMVAPAQLSQRKWNVPASVTLAQCILESAWGQSQLARRCNNYFGIKAIPGEAYAEFPTREVVTGRSVVELAKFAKYPSAIESFDAHARLLAVCKRYEMAMDHAKTPSEFATALQLCGYSSDPSYAYRLTQLIVEHELEQYNITPPETPVATQEAA